MSVQNSDIAAKFGEIADLLEIEGANPFRVRAYRNAARTVGDLGRPVQVLLERGGGRHSLPGIGADLAGKIQEIVRTGTCELLAQLRNEVPHAVAELLKIQGLGAKRVRTLHRELGVQTVSQLHEAAEAGRIRVIHGFGEKLEQQIAQATAPQQKSTGRFKRTAVSAVAEALLTHLRAARGVVRAVAAGSLRRGQETVGDLDLLVSVRTDNEAVERFVHYPDVREVLARGSTKASVVLKSGLQVDLRVVPPESFGAAWVYFTGSKAHSIALRRLAQQAGLKINEYGVFRGSRRVAGETEDSMYRAVGLRWIDPQLREGIALPADRFLRRVGTD